MYITSHSSSLVLSSRLSREAPVDPGESFREPQTVEPDYPLAALWEVSTLSHRRNAIFKVLVFNPCIGIAHRVENVFEREALTTRQDC